MKSQRPEMHRANCWLILTILFLSSVLIESTPNEYGDQIDEENYDESKIKPSEWNWVYNGNPTAYGDDYNQQDESEPCNWFACESRFGRKQCVKACSHENSKRWCWTGAFCSKTSDCKCRNCEGSCSTTWPEFG